MMVEKDISNRLNEIFEAKIGRILEIKQQHGKRDNDKRLWARIEMFPAGTYENVPFWGGGFDLETEMPHGMFVPPRENQLILILFLNGSFENPIAAIPFPHPYDDSFVDKYYNLIENINDISFFHYSGSRIIMREDGSIDIQKRIEESTGNFTNHTLKIKFEYDSGNNIRKKTITDSDNNIIIELTGDNYKVTDAAGQNINLRQKSGEEKVIVEKSGSQKIEMNSSSTDITGPLLNLLGATESFLKGDTWNTNWAVFNAAVQAATPGSTAQNAAAITAIQAAFAAFSAQLTNMLSTKIKGE
jgi:hypothetical protein